MISQFRQINSRAGSTELSAQELLENTRTMAELIDGHPRLVHQCQPDVAQRRILLRQDDMASMLDPFGVATEEDRRHVPELVPRANVGPVAHDASIKGVGAFGILRRLLIQPHFALLLLGPVASEAVLSEKRSDGFLGEDGAFLL